MKIKESKVVIKKIKVSQWRGLKEAGEVLGVSSMQVRRHIQSHGPGDINFSNALSKRMKERGVTVEG